MKKSAVTPETPTSSLASARKLALDKAATASRPLNERARYAAEAYTAELERRAASGDSEARAALAE